MTQGFKERLQSLPEEIKNARKSIAENLARREEDKKVAELILDTKRSEWEKFQDQLDKDTAREYALAKAQAEGQNILPVAKRIALNDVRGASVTIHFLNGNINLLKATSGVFGTLGSALLTTGIASEGHLENIGISSAAASTLIERTGNLLVNMGLQAAISLKTLSNIAGANDSTLIQYGLHQAGQLLEGAVQLGMNLAPTTEQAGPAFLIAGSAAIVLGLRERIECRELTIERNKARDHATAVMAGIAH